MLGIKDADEQKRTDKVIKLITKGGVSAEAGIQAITTVMRNLAGGGPRESLQSSRLIRSAHDQQH